MADRDDRMASVEVKILLSFIVPNVASVTFDDIYIEQWIDIKELHICFIYFIVRRQRV